MNNCIYRVIKKTLVSVVVVLYDICQLFSEYDCTTIYAWVTEVANVKLEEY